MQRCSELPPTTPMPRIRCNVRDTDCREYLEKEVAESSIERPIYLLGESFGGVVALAAAAERADLVDRIVLVNPATSFPRSVWPRLGPLLPQIPKVGPSALLPPQAMTS